MSLSSAVGVLRERINEGAGKWVVAAIAVVAVLLMAWVIVRATGGGQGDLVEGTEKFVAAQCRACGAISDSVRVSQGEQFPIACPKCGAKEAYSVVRCPSCLKWFEAPPVHQDVLTCPYCRQSYRSMQMETERPPRQN